MLRKFAGEDETDGRLDITGTHGVLPIDLDETRSFGSNTFEGVKDKGVHNSHCFRGDT